MNLYIMRHGQASFDAASDSGRQLTDFGVQQALKVGRLLAKANVSIDLVVASPYTRAQQTADNVLASFSSATRLESDCLRPESSHFQAQESIECLNNKNVLLVSHMPLVAMLSSYFVDGSIGGHGKSWSPATIACLQGEEFLPACMKLRWIKSPNELDSL